MVFTMALFFCHIIEKTIDMKKVNLFLLIMLPLAVLLGSCEKKEYVVPNRTVIVDLKPGNWVTSDNGKSYSAGINMYEIDNYFNERGGVLVYASFGDQTYEQLPQVYEGVSYRYITRPGQIIITVESSDGLEVLETPPGSVTIKIVLIESI